MGKMPVPVRLRVYSISGVQVPVRHALFGLSRFRALCRRLCTHRENQIEEAPCGYVIALLFSRTLSTFASAPIVHQPLVLLHVHHA